eukprot:c7029_g1_i1.p1 GENE.c7029_g1_i1~~c7029_g1_i1.p1  ORF type:complete len:351 (-),score=74.66 c7029_g1_i1:27-1079(-)
MHHNMNIMCKTLTGKIVTLQAEPATTIETLKTLFQNIEGIPSNKQRFIFAGKILQNHLTIDDYYIQNETIIFVTFDKSQVRGDFLSEHIKTSFPANERTNVPITTAVSIAFDDAIHNIVPAGIEFDPAVTGTCTFDTSKQTLQFKPTKPLELNTKYTLKLPLDAKVFGSVTCSDVGLISFTTSEYSPPKTLKIFGPFIAPREITWKYRSCSLEELSNTIKREFGSQSFDIEMELSVRVRDTTTSDNCPPRYSYLKCDADVLDLADQAEIRVEFTSKPPLPHSIDDVCAMFSTLFEGYPTQKIRSNGLHGSVLVEVMHECDESQREVVMEPLSLNSLQYRVLRHHMRRYTL